MEGFFLSLLPHIVAHVFFIWPQIYALQLEYECLQVLIALWSDLIYADTDDRGETSVPREKILNCLTSSIKVANLDDVVEQQKNLLYLITTSLSNGFRWTGIYFLSLFLFQPVVAFTNVETVPFTFSENFDFFIGQWTLLKVPRGPVSWFSRENRTW